MGGCGGRPVYQSGMGVCVWANPGGVPVLEMWRYGTRH